MDFMDPGPLLSGVLISMAGMAIFIYGKRMHEAKSLGIGLVMMVYPIFLSSILWMWLLAAGCIASLFILPRST